MVTENINNVNQKYSLRTTTLSENLYIFEGVSRRQLIKSNWWISFFYQKSGFSSHQLIKKCILCSKWKVNAAFWRKRHSKHVKKHEYKQNPGNYYRWFYSSWKQDKFVRMLSNSFIVQHYSVTNMSTLLTKMLTKWQLFCTLQLCFLELTDDKGTTHVTEGGGREFST